MLFSSREMFTHIWPFVALAFSTWAVSLGAIASLQEECYGSEAYLNTLSMPGQLAYVNGFSGDPLGSGIVMPCSTLFRFYWFIVALEFVVILITAGFLVSGFFSRSRIGVVGLLSVVTLLYISMTDTFLSAGSVPFFYSGTPRTRLRTMIAGSLMTATANCFLIIASGVDLEGQVIEERKEVVQKTGV